MPSALCLLVAAGLWLAAQPALAFEAKVLDSVVSVLPLWPGQERGGQPQLPPGTAPEGTGTAIRDGGYLVTALHVVARATAITVRQDLTQGETEPRRLAPGPGVCPFHQRPGLVRRPLQHQVKRVAGFRQAAVEPPAGQLDEALQLCRARHGARPVEAEKRHQGPSISAPRRRA